MTFEDLLEQVQKIPCEEKRAREADYCEAVFGAANLVALNGLLESCFGPPLKPEGKPPSADATKYSKAYGGVQGNQVLYYRLQNSRSEMAMLWPWSNGASMTLKLIRQ